MEKKMTYKEAIAQVLTMELPTEVREKMEALLATYEKKSGSVKKLTPVQQANLVLKEKIFEFMAENAGTRYQVSELIPLVEELHGLSVNKVSAQVRGLVTEGKVVRVEEKRKAYFYVESAEEIEEG